jgi:F-type H+-transporting ATPase subunit delta
MAKTSVAQPYAQALLELATAERAVEKFRAELRSVVTTLDRSPELGVVFSVPTITEAERKAVILELSQRLGLSRTVQNGLLVLAEKRRLAHLRDIVAAFERLADEATGIVRADVRTAAPLSLEQREALRRSLEQAVGRKVVLATTIDPSLLGGLRVEFGGRVYDASVTTKLDTLRDQILSAS